MKVKCLSCGVEKDTEVKEVYPYPDDGLVDDPIRPVSFLDCQDGRDWREVVVCHECFHRLEPDQWISRRCWETLEPVTPFGALPPCRLLLQFTPVGGWEGFSQSEALRGHIWRIFPANEWWCLDVQPERAYWSSSDDASSMSMRFEGNRIVGLSIRQGLALDGMKPVISQFELVQSSGT
jgi:hypothetical protein